MFKVVSPEDGRYRVFTVINTGQDLKMHRPHQQTLVAHPLIHRADFEGQVVQLSVDGGPERVNDGCKS
jgi:hypothetical protein